MKIPKQLKELEDEEYENANSLINAAVSVSLPVVDHRRLLVVDFHVSRKYYTSWMTPPKAWRYRVIVDKEDRELEIVYIDKGTKTVKSTTSDTRHEFLARNIYAEISKQDEKKLCGYLGANNDGNHGFYALRDIIDEIAAEMTARRREKRGLFAEQDYKLFSDELPDGCKRWVESLTRNEKTIVYNKGNTTGRCYVCGALVRANDRRFKQYQNAVCPNCGSDVRCYLKGGAADQAHTVCRFLIPQKNGDVFLLRGFVLLRDPEAEYKNIDDWLIEAERFAFRGKNVGTWRRLNKGCTWHIDRRNNCYAYYDRAWMAGFNEAKEGTAAKYVEKKYLRETKMRKDLERWIRFPIIEKLYKAGFTDIAHEVAYSPRREKSVVNVHAKTLTEFFKMPLGDVRQLGPADELSIRKVDQAQQHTAHGYSGEMLKLLVTAEIPANRDEWLSGYASLKKICGYILNQGSNAAGKSRHLYNVARDYCDYIRELEDLEMNTRDKDRLFPDDLYAAHEETSRLVQERRDVIDAKKRKAEEEAFAKRMNGLKCLEFADKKAGLKITVPLSSKELRIEGQRLHHCVGSYITQVAQGKTVILFVREIKDPEKSYYTLEYQNGKIRQCRTHCNEDYRGNAKVTAFLEKWLKHIKKIENKEAKTA